MNLESATKLLVISYAYPPVGEVGGHRVARFCRYLPEYGIQPVVVTVRPEHYQDRDDSVHPPEGIRVERTGVFATPLDLYRKWRVRAAPTNPSGARQAERHDSDNRAGSLRRNVLALLQIPDQYWGWYFSAVRAAHRLIAQERFAAIFSSAPPWTSHWVARRVSKRYALPWLADFRDPWSVIQNVDVPRWKRLLGQQMEENCLRRADRVLCNTDRLREFFLGQHADLPREKFVTLPNGFETPVIPEVLAPRESGRLLLHLGSLYAGRRIDTFCEAVKRLVQGGRLNPANFRILFLGDADPPLVDAARGKAPSLFESGCIQFQERVNWQEAQRILWNADVLLLFQGDLSLQVPAKFFEYLPTGKPILAVAREGALSDLVESTDAGMWASPDDPAGIAEKLLRVLDRPLRSPAEVQRLWYSTHHSRALTARLADIVREVGGAEVASARLSAE